MAIKGKAIKRGEIEAALKEKSTGASNNPAEAFLFTDPMPSKKDCFFRLKISAILSDRKVQNRATGFQIFLGKKGVSFPRPFNRLLQGDSS